MTCPPQLSAFLWGCLDKVPYEPNYCKKVPGVRNDAAVKKWAERICTKPSIGGSSLCPMLISPVAGYCAAGPRKQK